MCGAMERGTRGPASIASKLQLGPHGWRTNTHTATSVSDCLAFCAPWCGVLGPEARCWSPITPSTRYQGHLDNRRALSVEWEGHLQHAGGYAAFKTRWETSLIIHYCVPSDRKWRRRYGMTELVS